MSSECKKVKSLSYEAGPAISLVCQLKEMREMEKDSDAVEEARKRPPITSLPLDKDKESRKEIGGSRFDRLVCHPHRPREGGREKGRKLNELPAHPDLR